jgi:hypothetical protein
MDAQTTCPFSLRPACSLAAGWLQPKIAPRLGRCPAPHTGRVPAGATIALSPCLTPGGDQPRGWSGLSRNDRRGEVCRTKSSGARKTQPGLVRFGVQKPSHSGLCRGAHRPITDRPAPPSEAPRPGSRQSRDDLAVSLTKSKKLAPRSTGPNLYKMMRLTRVDHISSQLHQTIKPFLENNHSLPYSELNNPLLTRHTTN